MAKKGPAQKADEETQKELIGKAVSASERLKELFKKYDFAFRMVAVALIVSGFLICIYNIPNFRAYARSKNVFVVPFDTLYWCLIGFFFHYFGRKVASWMLDDYFRKRMHPKVAYYSQQQKQEKLVVIVKQLYEGVFHLAVTIINWWLFHNQIWFPKVIGGAGSCSTIFSTYPQWPEPNGYYLLAFYQFQMGTYVYHILDLLFFDKERYKKRNYGELFYHHFVAILLIAFSLFYNFVPIGMTVLFVHDSSDFIRGFSRAVGDSKACMLFPKTALVMNIANFVLFIYMRALVLPFCLIQSMQSNNPSVRFEQWSFLWLQCGYLLVISYAIYCIQCYWACFVLTKVKEQHQRNKQFMKWEEEQLKIKEKGESEGNYQKQKKIN